VRLPIRELIPLDIATIDAPRLFMKSIKKPGRKCSTVRNIIEARISRIISIYRIVNCLYKKLDKRDFLLLPSSVQGSYIHTY